MIVFGGGEREKEGERVGGVRAKACGARAAERARAGVGSRPARSSTRGGSAAYLSVGGKLY